MLDWNQRGYLIELVHADARKKEKSLRKARRHSGQTEAEFQGFVDGLREKLAYQQQVIAALDDDEEWETDEER